MLLNHLLRGFRHPGARDIVLKNNYVPISNWIGKPMNLAVASVRRDANQQ